MSKISPKEQVEGGVAGSYKFGYPIQLMYPRHILIMLIRVILTPAPFSRPTFWPGVSSVPIPREGPKHVRGYEIRRDASRNILGQIHRKNALENYRL